MGISNCALNKGALFFLLFAVPPSLARDRKTSSRVVYDTPQSVSLSVAPSSPPAVTSARGSCPNAVDSAGAC
eukprot:7154528-Prymnesium_polylepis.1